MGKRRTCKLNGTTECSLVTLLVCIMVSYNSIKFHDGDLRKVLVHCHFKELNEYNNNYLRIIRSNESYMHIIYLVYSSTYPITASFSEGFPYYAVTKL